jgi:hypothetical protein
MAFMSIFKGSIDPVCLTPISRLYAETVPEFARATAYLVSTSNTLPSLLIDANPASLLRVSGS